MSRLFPSVPRTDFGPAPPGYVPGLGRGAVGFTTRSDIGPARPMVEELTGGRGRSLPVPALPAGYGTKAAPTVPGAPEAATSVGGSAARASDDAEIAKYADSNFDEFSGYTNEALFASGEYDADDKEADQIYDAIDRRLESRRGARREVTGKNNNNSTNNQTPVISRQFAAIKRTLKEITLEGWESIPEAMDYSKQNKLRKLENSREKFTPLPDNLINPSSGNNQSTTLVSSVDDNAMGIGAAAGMGGSAAAAMGTITPDLTSIGRARDKMLGMNLDRMADSVGGQTVVDPKGYMTQLSHARVTSDTEVSDIRKAKLLLRSVIQTNPKHGPGWIAAARLEKETGKLAAARQIIMKGTEMAPMNEDVWIEAAAMQTPQHARAVLAKAVTHLPLSVPIWLLAANLESDPASQKAVLRRALEHAPTSVRLWKTAVQLETPSDALIMLSRAVELIPDSVEMWLALAKLETYDQARIVLNRARKAVPTDMSIWITASKLEEAHGNSSAVDMIVAKAVKSMAKFQVVLDRESWLQSAEECERSGAVDTCRSIVAHTIGLGVEDLDRKLTWTNDCVTYEAKGAVQVAIAIAARICSTFPGKKSAWLKYAQLERSHGTPASLDAVLAAAVRAVPTAEVLWLMRAKESWRAGNVPLAREILHNAFEANKNSEEIWLAAMKLEYESHEFERARGLLTHARTQANTPRVWMKSAKMERLLKNDVRQKELLEAGIKLFPAYPKLHMMYAQLLIKQNMINEARDAFKRGIKEVGGSNVDIWIVYAKFEMDIGTNSSKTKTEKKEKVKVEGNGASPMDTSSSSSSSSSPSSSAAPKFSLLESTPYSKARSILESARLRLPHQPRLWLAAIRLELLSCNPSSALLLQAKSLQDCPGAGMVWAQAIAMDERPKKKSRAFEALERCNEDAYVLMAVAKLFWIDRKIAKSRSWFSRSLLAMPTLGDVWVYAYKFELEHGTQASQSAMQIKCNEAEPTHGEIWTTVAKQDDHANWKPEQIMIHAAKKISMDVFTPLAPI